ncbi:MAG: ribosome maturation factor RimP [Coriobacteriales bacterium]|nr:ribosome maturation factor RimP [Coriobacteriales bacterium]
MRGERQRKLLAALEAAAAQHGFELVDVELVGAGRARVIRVLLDKEGGFGIDDLASANPWIDAIIEENEPFTGSYTLEVSSPGIDRPLRTLEHFARFTNEEAKLNTEPIDGRGAWTGVLAGVENDTVLLTVDGETRRIPHSMIKKARLKGRVDFSKDLNKDFNKDPNEGPSNDLAKTSTNHEGTT